MPCERISIGATGRSVVSVQPIAVAVALRRDLPCARPERLDARLREAAYSAAGSTRTAGRPSAVERQGQRGRHEAEARRRRRRPAAPARSLSPLRSARPSRPPKAPRNCVLREPSTSGTSTPPATHR